MPKHPSLLPPSMAVLLRLCGVVMNKNCLYSLTLEIWYISFILISSLCLFQFIKDFKRLFILTQIVK